MSQKYNSACTSINKDKLPMVFKKVDWKKGTRNLDYGGGKYDNATEYLKEFGVTNMIYDPFNRSKEWNESVMKNSQFETATLSNVLNVIYEEDCRLEVLKAIKEKLMVGGELYISVYEGDRKGIAKVNDKTNSCQLHKPTQWYMDEVVSVFGNATRKGKIITACKYE